MEPGDLLFLPPREHHVYSADPRSPWTIFWMHFRGLRAEDYLESLGVSRSRPVVSALMAPCCTAALLFPIPGLRQRLSCSDTSFNPF